MTRSGQKSERVTAKRRLEFGNGHQQDANSVVLVEKESEAKSPAKADVPLQKNDWNIFGNYSSSDLMTPVKKKCRRPCDERDRDRNHKQGIALYFSPPKTTATDARKISVLVTPEQKEEEDRETEAKGESQSQQRVPVYIHKNLNYQRRGQAFLNIKLKRAFDLVEEHYVIPSSFESDRSYGPLSGTCFEERVVNAYDKGFLLPCEPSKGGVLICAYCSKLGHRQDDCPDLT